MKELLSEADRLKRLFFGADCSDTMFFDEREVPLINFKDEPDNSVAHRFMWPSAGKHCSESEDVSCCYFPLSGVWISDIYVFTHYMKVHGEVCATDFYSCFR